MLKHILENVTFPLIAYREGFGGIMGNLRSLEESQYWPRERILELQRERLKKLLVHAYENTGFYRKRFDDAGFNPYSFRHADELTVIPILTKEQIREHIGSLVARNYLPADIHPAETGGTSEVKMRFFRDNKSLSMKEAAIYRFGRWAGWNFGDYMGLVWPAHQDFMGYNTWKSRIRNEFYKRQVLFAAALIDDRACEGYLRQVEKKRPTTILAFSSPIHELAKYMARQGIDNVRLKGLITTGEPLYDHQRKLAADMFHCDVLDSYRSREAGPMAQECEAHQGMHINAECLYLELDKKKQMAGSKGEAGSVIVTDLLNYGMPLIRYSMNDMAVMSDKSCPCGRNLPMIDKIVGRALDVFVTPGGKLVSTIALVMYMVNAAPGFIGQMQVIQDAADHLLFKMTRDPLPSREVMDHQRKIIDKLFGAQMKITYEFLDKIPSEKSGKYLFARRLIPIPE
jgi:phenylacetate-CoA ligase